MRFRYFQVNKLETFDEIKVNFDDRKKLLYQSHALHCFVGNNGSGKTKILETLVTVFSQFEKKIFPKFPLILIYDIEVDSKIRTICFVNRPESPSKGEKLSTKLIILKEKYMSVSDWESFVNSAESSDYIENMYIGRSILSEEVLATYLPKVFLYRTANTNSCGKQSELIKEYDLKLAISTLLLRQQITNERLQQTFSNILAKLGLNRVQTNLQELLKSNFLELESSAISNIDLFQSIRKCKFNLRKLKLTFGKETNNIDVEYDDLSDGERVLLGQIALFSLLEGSKNTLLLLDEPEIYLHPVWKYDYIKLLEESLGKQTACHSIICTHDALLVGSLEKEQVQILKKEKSKIIGHQPLEAPQGMGVAGLLKSEMFGLPSTLDAPTLRALDERNQLVAKKAKIGLTEDEEIRLRRLRDYLNDLSFSTENRDPMYKSFIEKMYEVRRKPLGSLLTTEELVAQEELAQKIVAELVKEERQNKVSDLARELKIQLQG